MVVSRAENGNNNNNNNNGNNNGNNGNPLDSLRDLVARRPVAQKVLLRLLLSPGLTGTLAVAGSYLAGMNSPLSALLTPPTASDVALGLAAAVPLVALDALLLGPDYSPEAPKRSIAGAPVSSSEKQQEEEEEKGPAAATSEKDEEEASSSTSAASSSGTGSDRAPKRPDPAVVEAGRLALLRSLSASGVAVFDAGALASGGDPSSFSSSETAAAAAAAANNNPFSRRRLRAAAHAYSSRAVRSTMAREIPGNPVAEAALVVSARAGTEMLARCFALRFSGGWIADRVVEAGGLSGEDSLLSLLSFLHAPPDAPLGTAGEVLVLAVTAVGLVGIGVAGVVAAEAEAARVSKQLERKRSDAATVSAAAAAAAASASVASSEEATTSTPPPPPPQSRASTVDALERGGLAVLQQITRARADAALLDASLDALRLLVVGAAFVASGDHVAASLLCTVVRELPCRRWLVARSSERAARARAEARRDFEALVAGDEKFAALRRGMEERREKRALWLKRQEELRSGRLGMGGSGREEEEEGDGKDEL